MTKDPTPNSAPDLIEGMARKLCWEFYDGGPPHDPQCMAPFRLQAAHALQFLHDQGLAVVPLEATPAMLKAVADSKAFAECNDIIALHAVRTGGSGLSTNPMPIAYRAMISAASAAQGDA